MHFSKKINLIKYMLRVSLFAEEGLHVSEHKQCCEQNEIKIFSLPDELHSQRCIIYSHFSFPIKQKMSVLNMLSFNLKLIITDSKDMMTFH